MQCQSWDYYHQSSGLLHRSIVITRSLWIEEEREREEGRGGGVGREGCHCVTEYTITSEEFQMCWKNYACILVKHVCAV